MFFLLLLRVMHKCVAPLRAKKLGSFVVSASGIADSNLTSITPVAEAITASRNLHDLLRPTVIAKVPFSVLASPSLSSTRDEGLGRLLNARRVIGQARIEEVVRSHYN
jgi:hypothetical protein